MADNIVIDWQSQGGDRALSQVTSFSKGLDATAKAAKRLAGESRGLSQLAGALGTTFTEAQKLAKGLGLSGTEAAKAVKSLQQLNEANATTQQRFNALNKELGTNAQQFLVLDRAVDNYNQSLAEQKAQQDRLKASQQDQANTLRRIAQAQEEAARSAKEKSKADQQAQKDAERLFQTNTKLTQQRVDEEFKQQAAAARAKAQADREAAKAAERLFQNNARLSQQRVDEELRAQAAAAREAAAAQEELASAQQTAGFAAAAFAGAGVFALQEIISSSIQAQREFQSLTTALNNATGGQGEEALAFINREVDRLSLSLPSAIEAFTQLNAAARGTAVEGEGVETIFSAIAQAGRVNNLSLERQEKAYLAITQIISKGVVQQEELRGQLSEALPGAVQIFARALNVTTAELGALIQAGEVGIPELLKFAEQLQEETAGGVAAAGDTIGASFDRLSTEINRLQVSIGENLLPITQPIIDSASAIATGFNSLSPPLQQAILLTGGLTVAFTLLSAALVANNALQITRTASLAAQAIATQAATLSSGAYNAILALLNTQLTFNSAAIALQSKALIASVASFNAAALAAGKFGLATLAAAAPLIALGAALAGLAFVTYTNQLREANAEIERVAGAVDASSNEAFAAANRTKAAINELNQARKQGRALTEEEIRDAERLVAANNFRIDGLRQELAAQQAATGGNAEQQQARENLIKTLETSITALESQNNTLAQNIGLTDESTEAVEENAEAAEKAAQRRADALKAAREQEFSDTEQARDDQQLEADRRRQDAALQAERLRQDEKEARERALQEEIASIEENAQIQQEERAKAFEEAQQQFREEGQQRIQDAERQFNEQQQAEQEAFEDGLNEERRRSQEDLNARERQIDRQTQLATARGRERGDLLRQFREQDREAQIRQGFERQAFGGRTLEEEQRARDEEFEKRREEFEAQQQEQQLKFEESVLNPLREELETQLEQRKIDFETNVLTPLKEQSEARIEALREAARLREQELDRQYEDEKRAADRALEDQKRAADRAFQQERRAFEEETARRVKAILETTNIPAINDFTGVELSQPLSRFTGGSMAPNQPYLVGDAPGGKPTKYSEIVVPNTSSYVIAAKKAQEWLGQTYANNAAAGRAIASQSGGGINKALVSEIRAVRKQIADLNLPSGEFHQHNSFSQESVEDRQFWQRQYAIAKIQRRSYR